MSNRILFFGNERLATGVTTQAPTLRALVEAGYEVAAVVVAQNDHAPSRQQRGLEIAEAAAEHRIPLLSPAKLGQAEPELRGLGAEAAVLVAYGKIVPRGIIDIFPRGIVNIHPSLLPRHRGSTPIESVILNGEPETGVSLMRLTAEVDAGPLYTQTKSLVPPQATKQALADSLLAEGIKQLLDFLPRILGDPPAVPVPQDESLATHDGLIRKEDGIIDYRKSAERLAREIRAYAGWPRSRATLGSKEVIITKARPLLDTAGPAGRVKTDNGQLVVFCRSGALVIDSLIPAGKPEMSGQAFLAGYKNVLS